MSPGDRLKEIRTHLGVTTREVEQRSKRIADSEGNAEFYISNAWITQIENTQSTPSIYKLFTLSVIYSTKFTDLLALYGVDLNQITRHQLSLPLPRTHMTNLEVYDNQRAVSFPVQFDPSFRADRTALLSRIVQVWGEIPISLIQHLDIRRCKYGYIGLGDFTLHPLLRPGSFVQIDDGQNQIRKVAWRTEFDRPIYFVELRDGYACSWCDLQGRKLTLLPHPLSPVPIRQFDYPSDAEIVGRVTAVAMRIVDSPNSSAGEPARLPGKS